MIHHDQARRAVVSDRVVNRGFARLFNSQTRDGAIRQLGETIRRVHALPLPADAVWRDPSDLIAPMRARLSTFAVPSFVRTTIDQVLAERPKRGRCGPRLGRSGHRQRRTRGNRPRDVWHTACPITRVGSVTAPVGDIARTSGCVRRAPETTVLYRVVRDHAAAWFANVRERSDGVGYPRFVEREFEKFLDCGLLERGFVRVRCGDCAAERHVAFSCKTRGFCPSCTSRRMTNTAAHLVERVLPHVPYGQWLSLPRRVRLVLARDAKLLGWAVRRFLGKVLAWQRRCARRRGLIDPHSGAVTFVQRFGSLLNLNCHAHALVPYGVFVAAADGTVAFRALPPPTDAEVARLLAQISWVIHARIERLAHDHDNHDEPPDAFAHDQAAALSEPSPFGRFGAISPTGRRTAFIQGYSLHADRQIDAEDRDGLERLCRYGARSPVANSRLSVDGAGRVVMALKRPLRDGRVELVFAPSEFVRRLAVLVPPPRRHLTRYHGVFAPNHRLRAAVVPGSIAGADETAMPATAASTGPR